MKQEKKEQKLWILCVVAMTVFVGAMVWLHYQQLCASGSGEDLYTSDLGQHLYFAQSGLIYSATSLLIGPAYAIGSNIGIALLLGVFHLAAVAAFAWGLKAALPAWSLPARLLASLVVNLAQAVYIPRGGFWYLGTITGTIYHNTTYIMLAPFALLTVLWFYRVWQNIDGKLDLRSWLIYTVLLTVATSFKANLIFAFAPALLVLLIVDFIRTRGKNIANEVWMGCSVFPGVGLCILEANVLFTGEDSGIRLIFTTDFNRNAMLWGIFNEPALLGLARSLPFVAAVALLMRKQAFGNFRYRFSLYLFAVSMAEAVLLVETGERMYHGNFWWGPFICFWVFWLESVSVFFRQALAERKNWRVWVCGVFLCWHIISGICYLVQLLQGSSYSIPIETFHIGF